MDLTPNYSYCQSFKTLGICQKISAIVHQGLTRVESGSELGKLLTGIITDDSQKYLVCGGSWWIAKVDGGYEIFF